VIDRLRSALRPYSVPTAASEAILAALDDAGLAAARRHVEVIKPERTRMLTELARPSCFQTIDPSEGNFILDHGTDAADGMRRAQNAGMLIRDFSRAPGTAN
jgi:histidinol-phosphate aminotransferase